MGRPNTVVTVSAAESEQLGSIARSRSLPHSLVRRARIVLMLPQIMTMIANISCDHIHLEVASEVSPLVLRGEQGKFGMLTRCGWSWS